MIDAQDRTRWHQRESARIATVAAEVAVSRGFADLTMTDVAAAAGVSRSALYGHFRGVLDMVLTAASTALVDDAAVLQPQTTWWSPWPIAEVIAAGHEVHGDLERLVRAIAGTGVPRARAFVATLDLARREDALTIVAWMHRPADERVHLVERLLEPDLHRHLRVRCGWTAEEYTSHLASEVERIRRRPTSASRAR